jgi:hypothetical protein
VSIGNLQQSESIRQGHLADDIALRAKDNPLRAGTTIFRGFEPDISRVIGKEPKMMDKVHRNGSRRASL